MRENRSRQCNNIYTKNFTDIPSRLITARENDVTRINSFFEGVFSLFACYQHHRTTANRAEQRKTLPSSTKVISLLLFSSLPLKVLLRIFMFLLAGFPLCLPHNFALDKEFLCSGFNYFGRVLYLLCADLCKKGRWYLLFRVSIYLFLLIC